MLRMDDFAQVVQIVYQLIGAAAFLWAAFKKIAQRRRTRILRLSLISQ
jgi:hypothetical protein